MRKRYTISGVILVLLVLFLSGCSGDTAGRAAETGPGAEEVTSETPAEAAPPSEPGPSPEAGPSAAPVTFEGTDLEGGTVSSDVFSQSKLTMINVWATYCGPCLNEMPELGQLAAEYEPGEFQIIGIVSDVLEGDDQSLAESLVQRTGANYTHLLLNESIYYALLTNVNAVPTTFFLDSDGMALGCVIGAREKSAWEAIINELLEAL